jgi:hypothetical protein
MPGTAIEMSESKVRKDMSFIEPQTKFKDILSSILRAIFFGINMSSKRSASH